MKPAELQKRYARWASFNGCNEAAGYGAAPHGQRLEGYPKDHAKPSGTATAALRKGMPPSQSSLSRGRSLRAMDAASRPENLPPFYPHMQILHNNGASI